MVDLEKDLSNFKLNIDKKDRATKEYIRLLNIAKKEYQKLFEENKRLKEENKGLKKSGGVAKKPEEIIEEQPVEIKENKKKSG